MAQINDRLNKIAAKGAELVANANAEQIQREQTIAKYANDIKALAPRIKPLVVIAKALIQNNIPLGKKKSGVIEYEDLCSDGWYHRLGFFYKWENGKRNFLGIGIEGGGCAGDDLAVDENGDMVKRIDPYYHSYQYDGYHDYCDKCKRFLTDSDAFGQRVNEYVDNL